MPETSNRSAPVRPRGRPPVQHHHRGHRVARGSASRPRGAPSYQHIQSPVIHNQNIRGGHIMDVRGQNRPLIRGQNTQIVGGGINNHIGQLMNTRGGRGRPVTRLGQNVIMRGGPQYRPVGRPGQVVGPGQVIQGGQYHHIRPGQPIVRRPGPGNARRPVRPGHVRSVVPRPLPPAQHYDSYQQYSARLTDTVSNNTNYATATTYYEQADVISLDDDDEDDVIEEEVLSKLPSGINIRRVERNVESEVMARLPSGINIQRI